MSATHGLASTYRSRGGGCRCDECRAAHTMRARREKERRVARLRADPTLAEHGSAQTYKNWDCRCKPCTDANTADCRQRAEERRDAAR